MEAVGYNMDAFWLALIDWAHRVSGWTVIKLNEPGPRPPKPYLTINLTAPSMVPGTDCHRWGEVIDGHGVDLVCGQRMLTCELQSFNDYDAMSVMGALQNSLQLNIYRDPLRKAGLGLGEVGRPNDITTALETQMERRAHIEVQFYFASNTADSDGTPAGPTGGIKTVNIDGKYKP